MLQEIAPWIAGLGIGSVLTAIIQWKINIHIEEKKRSFNEKKEAYVGLLAALHESAVKGTDSAAKGYALWQTRVELVGSNKVVKFAQDIVDTKPGTKERNIAFSGIISSMRKDLAISSD